MNNTAFLNTVRFVVLVFFQVTVFNNIHFWGFITPYPYILFILLYPLNINRNLFLILSFALGLILDIFNNSGGIHTTARSEEHTSELQSRPHLVCRLLLEKKNKIKKHILIHLNST